MVKDWKGNSNAARAACAVKRFERIYSKGTLREVYIFSKRVECYKNNIRTDRRANALMNFCWYVFQKGYKGYPVIRWL